MTTNVQPVFQEDIDVKLRPVTFELILPKQHQLYNCYKLGFKGPYSMIEHYMPALRERYSASLELVAVVVNDGYRNWEAQPLNKLTVVLHTTQPEVLEDAIAAAKNWLIAIDMRAPGDLTSHTEAPL